MNWKFWQRNSRQLSENAIALLAQAHAIHQVELDAARDAVRAELKQQVRDALMRDPGEKSTAYIVDKMRIDAGLVFSQTAGEREEWVAYVKEHRVALQDAKYEEIYGRMHAKNR